MTSIAPIAQDQNFQALSPSATDRVPAATLDSQFSAFKLRFNDLLTALGVSIRDDDTLVDELVRLRNLHPEVAAAIASASGWQPKDKVLWATTANITLSGLGTQAGGEWTAALTAGHRILVKDQTAADENGLYTAAAGAWARATDADTAAELGYAFVGVNSGVTNGQTTWVATVAADGLTLGTTGVPFALVGTSNDLSGRNVLATGSTAYRTLADHLSNVGLFPVGVGTEDRANQHTYDPATSALRCGASDMESQNDERNFWRGLSSLGGATPGGDSNAWGTPALIGLFSVAFNRNGVSYGTYSTTFGHDCITYGIASMAGGAGSCAGDPDAPTSPAFEGYCSLSWGKNCLASGSKAIALGEEAKAQARGSIAAGYSSETAGHSGDSGTGSVALGYSAKSYGNGGLALGRDVVASASPFAVYYAQISNGGTGYTALDVLTVAGGTGTAATIRVDSVNGSGVITAVTVLTRGRYTVKPSSPNAVTGGTGTSASLIVVYFDSGAVVGVGANPGSPMQVGGGSLGLGMYCIRPTIEFLPADNPSNDSGSAIVRGSMHLRRTVVTGGDDLEVAEIRPVATNTGGGGYGGVHMRARVAGTMTDGWMVDAGNVSGGVCLYPVADNATRLGAAANRPSVIYAITGTINTSDEREKRDIGDIPDTWLDAWAEVKFQAYRWKDAVATKGDGARWHVGVIAQMVRDAFAAAGLDPLSIGILCHDTWTNKDGSTQDRYGIRYEEALVMECALMRRRLDRLERAQ